MPKQTTIKMLKHEIEMDEGFCDEWRKAIGGEPLVTVWECDNDVLSIWPATSAWIPSMGDISSRF
ncbi:hypothetical protein [Halocatena marina]|uniref:hypothetical protein n=1 Tax=Halocatena marina TaxID=2934937 RepID=UPI00200D18CC|nr:hypothetical protein [Halocatena marina]